MEKIDAALKTKWLKALRSGRYRQGQGALKRRDNYGKLSYCCLGVACNLVNSKWRDHSNGYGDEIDWVDGDGVKYEGGTNVLPFLPKQKASELIVMNDDDGLNFKEIAQWIEDNL